MMADRKANKEERKEEMERQIGSLASKMDTNEAKEEPDRKADQEMMEANQARMEESLKEAMRVAVSAIEGKMEAAVNTVRSELDEQIEKTQAELRTVEASLDIRALEVNLDNMRTDFITNLTMVNLGARPIHKETLAQKCDMEETVETINVSSRLNLKR
jgi:hypothetical protein